MRKKKGGGGGIANPKTATGFAECFQELCCVSAQSKADLQSLQNQTSSGAGDKRRCLGGIQAADLVRKKKTKQHNEP